MFIYPGALYEDTLECKLIRIARHSQCQDCECSGLHPSIDDDVLIVEQQNDGDLNEIAAMCECGHSWSQHGGLESLDPIELNRRARVGQRIDECLEDTAQLSNFAYEDIDIQSLRKQMIIPAESLEMLEDRSEEREVTPDSDAAGSPAPSSTTQKRSRESSSSDLSDAPLFGSPSRKRRRLQSSAQSDEEDEDAAGEDSKPSKSSGAKKVPGHKSLPIMSGVRGNAKAGKKRAAAAAATNTNRLNSLSNGIPQIPKIKVEEDIADNESVAGSVVSNAGEAGRASIDIPPKEKIVVSEHRLGYIQYCPVRNDGDPRSMIILTGLKCLFQRQLPKMPREYIARLVMDRSSVGLAMVKHGYKVVAGITYRPFAHRGFIEIVFCAVSSANQVKGYGGHLMDHFKKHIQDTYTNVDYFLTYADNYAVGYFRKQGFSKDVTLDRSKWAGYIKDYEGATLLQCTLVPRVDYTNIRDTLMKQKEYILTKIRERSQSHIVRPGLPFPITGNMILDCKDIPGLLEAGWTETVTEQKPELIRPPQYVRMTRALRALQSHPQSWPFRAAVNKADVQDYYEVIAEPMDLHTMQLKLEGGKYSNTEDFIYDVYLVIKNCLQYNPPDSVYAKAASKLRKFFEDALSKELAGKWEGDVSSL